MSEYLEEETETKIPQYSVLTLVLLVFILQAGFGMIVNVIRNIDIFAKLKFVNNAYNTSLKRNNNLKHELDSFNSAKSLESIARNNLKMAGKNEILLILNADTSENGRKSKKEEKPVKEKGIFYKR